MKFDIKKIAIFVVILMGGIFMLFPFLWMISTSFKTQAEALAFPPTWIPKQPTFSAFYEVWSKLNFPRYLLVSFIMAILTPIGVLITAVLSAYAFSWFRFPGREPLFLGILSLMMIT